MRNRYLDLLRAAAIARVVVYHLFGWPWLSVLLPAMGIMFALAGSLTAASLDRRGAGPVITSRLRRLLPPLWLLGLIAVPVMLRLGWAAEEDGEHPFGPARLAFWILPLGDPPGSDRGIDVWEPLWYLRAYVWFVLLSPVLYLAWRKAGWLAVAAPLLLIAVLDRSGVRLPGTADAAMWDFATYGACWMAGFAHHDGRLARTRWPVVAGAAAVLGAAALYWLHGHPGGNGYDLNDVPEAQALWSLAVVLPALRWRPPMDWLSRIRPLDATVTLLNNRAVTVYLWHNIAIAAVWPVLGYLALDDLGALGGPVDLVTAVILTAAAVCAFGWAEDLAARRRPALWPTTERPRAAQADGTDPAEPDRSGMPEAVWRYAFAPPTTPPTAAPAPRSAWPDPSQPPAGVPSAGPRVHRAADDGGAWPEGVTPGLRLTPPPVTRPAAPPGPPELRSPHRDETAERSDRR